MLNVYFSLMTDILFNHDITFDKYIGDCIMAYGNAPLEQPDHAVQTCRAALKQVAALPSLHKTFAQRGWPSLDFRIGLHTGTVLYGDLGSQTRSNYTIMGDTVNVASRLEGANKMFGTKILISESTHQAAQNEIETRELDFLRVEGKKWPIRVYELAALKGDLSPVKREAFAIFSDALRLYRERRFAEARAEFLRATSLLPGDRPSNLYIDRCDQFTVSYTHLDVYKRQAHALGARVYPNKKKEIGWYRVHLTAEGKKDPLMKGGANAPRVFQWHGDTFDLPKGARRLASSSLCKNQAFRFGNNVYGLQYHLEVDGAMVQDWLVQPGAERELFQIGPNQAQKIQDMLPRRLPALHRLAHSFFSGFVQHVRAESH